MLFWWGHYQHVAELEWNHLPQLGLKSGLWHRDVPFHTILSCIYEYTNKAIHIYTYIHFYPLILLLYKHQRKHIKENDRKRRELKPDFEIGFKSILFKILVVLTRVILLLMNVRTQLQWIETVMAPPHPTDCSTTVTRVKVLT